MSSSGFLPNTDAGLLAWSLNFKTLITATPTAYGLTAALATAYGALHDAYATALAAADPAIRTRSSVATKNTARTALKNNARALARIVYGTVTVTDAQKLALGLTVRSAPTPIPVPATAPGLDVISVSEWTVRIRLHDIASGERRGRPPGTDGASVFTYVGATPPSDLSGWQFEGNNGKTDLSISFSDALPPGTRVWITACWFNGRKQPGPRCAPATTNLQGSVSLAA